MRKNITQVIDAFLQRRALHVGSCSTNGRSIFSYSLEIAHYNDDGSVWVTTTKSTPTTNSQIHAVAQALSHLTHCRIHSDCSQFPELAKACKQSTKATTPPH